MGVRFVGRALEVSGMSSSIDPYAELASLFLTDEPEPHMSPRRPRGEIDPPPPAIPIRTPWPAPSTRSEPGSDLGRERAAAEPASSAPRSADEPLPRLVGAPIEIALVGNLPVMGGLWLTQYADQVARREGPTALVRLERGQVTVELMRDPAHRGFLDKAESAESAIVSLVGVAKRWIICPGNEAAVDGPLPGDALSLLTGGDDAATVGAYRIMKNLAERWHASHWTVPPIGLVVLGASPDRVDEVAEKLDRTTKAFLDVDISVTSQQQRMDTIDSASRRTFTGSELSVHDVVRRVRKPCAVTHALDECVCATAAASTPVESEPVHDVARDPLAATMSKLAPKPSPRQPPRPIGRLVEPIAERVAPLAASSCSVHSQPTNAAPSTGPRLVEATGPSEPFESDASFMAFTTDDIVGKVVVEPRDAPPAHRRARDEGSGLDERAASVPTRAPGSSLASHIPGLSLLPLHPPNQPDVELARDTAGRLHLVTSDRHLVALRPAEAWARAHLDLLRIAFPALHPQADEMSLDVVTFDAPSIIPLHGTGLRLHLLVETPNGCQHVGLNRGG